MTGEAQIMFPAAASGMGYIKQGKIRALAVGSAEPSPLVPGVPTLAASGVPGYESVSPQGVFAPAKTPAAIIHRLQETIARVVNASDVSDKLLATGVQPVGSTPEAFAAALRAEIDRMDKLIKKAGIREE